MFFNDCDNGVSQASLVCWKYHLLEEISSKPMNRGLIL